MRSPRVLRAAFFVAAALATIPSAADHMTYDTAEACMQSGSVMTGLPTCTNYGDGTWRASHPRDPAADARGMIGTVVTIWVLLVGGSVWWVVSTARRHGDPVGTALVGALVGGPLFVLMYGSNSDLARRSRKLYRWTDRLPEDPAAFTAIPPETDTAARLRELTRLRDQGLITEDEHATRRRAIIDEV